MRKIHENRRTFLFVILVLIVVATCHIDGKWPNQLGIYVESWVPRTRTRRVRKQSLLPQRNQQHYRQEILHNDPSLVGLTMVPVRIEDRIDSLPTSTTPETILSQKQPTLEQRIATILEFVDSTILDSSSTIDMESVLERVHSQHRGDFDTAKSSYLEIEERDTGGIPSSPFSFQRIPHPHSSESTPRTDTEIPTLAIRSNEPVLDASSVDAVIKAAEDVWKAEEGNDASTSRFTYQYSGNSEAHVFDFITTTPSTTTATSTDSAGRRAISALNEALQRKIYPTIREAFFGTNTGASHEKDDGTRLFVYDALVIRYNSTKAAEAAKISGDTIQSAGQPLHRDLGLVSVNIMLNSANDFTGGGTFFENQLLGHEEAEPLKPSGIGHCLAHSAAERHAGAGTTAGVRDILVLFVSACCGTGELCSKTKTIRAPAELLSARLKSCRAFCEREAVSGAAPIESEEQWMQAQQSVLLCRILHQRLAVNAVPKGLVPESLLALNNRRLYCDGEALQYLGTVLMEYSSVLSNPGRSIDVLEIASECFRVASLVTPCDSRVYNNLGIILGRINEMEQNNDKTNGYDPALAVPSTRRIVEQESAYQKGLYILQRSIKAGCTNESLTRDLESLSLNYGLFVANQDRFRDAVEILEPVAAIDASTEAGKDAYRLWTYCRDRYLEIHAQES